MMSLSFLQAFGLIATMAVVLVLGARSGRSVKSAAGYSLNGRKAGPILIAGSVSGTIIGGSATVGTAQMAATIGLSAWWFTLGSGIALLILALFYANPLRGSGLETIPQYLTIHYGRGAGPLTSLVSAIGILFSGVASALAGIHMIALMFGTPPWVAAVMIVVLVIAYVAFGGMKGAGVSGLLKIAILWVTLAVAGAGATMSLAEMPNFDALFPPTPWFDLLGRGAGETVANLLALIVGVICTQTYVQAIYSASDTRVAAIGTTVAAAITIPVGLPSIAVGMYMHATEPGLAPVLALPMYFVRHMPDWLGGIGLAGILLSVVGSIAGLALGIGTMIANDIGRGVFGITDDRRVLLLNRASVAGVTVAAIAIALANLDSYVLDWNYMSMALRGAAVFLPLSLAIFWPRRLQPSMAVISMVASIAAAVLCRVAVPIPLNPLFTGLVVSALVVATGLRMRATARTLGFDISSPAPAPAAPRP